MSNTSVKVAIALSLVLATPAASFARGGGGRAEGGRNGREPTKRCAWRANWRGGYAGQPERGRQRFQSSRAAAAAHKRPGDSAV